MILSGSSGDWGFDMGRLPWALPDRGAVFEKAVAPPGVCLDSVVKTTQWREIA